MMPSSSTYEAIVIGASAGGTEALKQIVSALPRHFPLPIFVTKHVSDRDDQLFLSILRKHAVLSVELSNDKTPIQQGVVYLAPADYHMYLENKALISLSMDDPVSYARPSVDVLFESAASIYQSKLLAIVLTGGNQDGAQGVKTVHAHSGYVIAQTPEEALMRFMPQAAIDTGCCDAILTLHEIITVLQQLIVDND